MRLVAGVKVYYFHYKPSPMTYKSLFLLTLVLFSLQSTAQKIDQKALQELVKVCRDTHSVGLSIWIDGKPYKDYVFDSTDGRAATYSAQKSLISLAIGRLVDDGRIASIDSPVYKYYPEWKQGLKKTVTVRQLLNHTSAIECNESDPDGWDPADAVQYALCASLLDTPGHYFLYNDKAVDLLRGIVQKASGQKLDAYIADVFFKPMGISDYKWDYDKVGTPVNLLISPAALVKMGQLVLNKGTWGGKPLVSEQWLRESMKQGQPFVPNCGLLWWRIPEKTIYTVDDDLLAQFRAAGVPEDFVKKYSALKGRYEDVNIPDEKLAAIFGKDWKTVLDQQLYAHYPRRAKWGMSDTYIGYKAEGWLGQYVVIYPEKNLVACRMIKQSSSSDNTELRDFEQYVYKLVQ